MRENICQIGKYIDLNITCIPKEKEVMDMLYRYKEAFSLRDKIDTCCNTEVEINITDKSPFFIRPYHVRGEDNKAIDKEMKCLCYFGILKEGFSPYSNPVMLTSQKVTKDKRILTNVRHLNAREAMNNLAYSLVRHIFSPQKLEMLGTSVLDLKDAFHLLAFRRFKKVFWNITTFLECLIFKSKNACGIKHLSFNLAILHKCKFRMFTK